jgi:hypothetical protein
MIQCLTKNLLKYFPNDRQILWDEYICDEIRLCFHRKEDFVTKIFDQISRPWSEITWKNVYTVCKDSHNPHAATVPFYLSPTSFIHVFPSLLDDYFFIENHLDLRVIQKDWKLKFYFSLNHEVIELIKSVIQDTKAEFFRPDVILASYWHSHKNRDTILLPEELSEPWSIRKKSPETPEERQQKQLVADFTEKLADHFSVTKTLYFEDFICDRVIKFYDGNEALVQKAYSLFSVPWPEINLPKIETLEPEYFLKGCVITDFVSPKCFMHIFPALLLEVLKGETGFLVDHFIEFHLDRRNVWRNWEQTFYASLDKKIGKFIVQILHESGYPNIPYMYERDTIEEQWK